MEGSAITRGDIKTEVNGIWSQSKREGGENISKRIKKLQSFYLLLFLFLWDSDILCDKTHNGHNNKWECLEGNSWIYFVSVDVVIKWKQGFFLIFQYWQMRLRVNE